MTIRSRLLLMLLPPLTAFLILVALFFYHSWSKEILNNFESRLKSIVVTAADLVSPKDVEAPEKNENFLLKETFSSLKYKLPVNNLFILKIEPVKIGDTVLKETSSDLNEPYTGNNSQNAFRQVILLSTDPHSSIYDFSENNEHTIYFTKAPLTTPIFEAKQTHERLMSAYAPILDSQNNVVALVAADMATKTIDATLKNALLVISLGGLFTLAMVVLTTLFTAHKLAKPVQQLNEAALAIAAGDYESNITVGGPKEIVELSNTFNTMSECLIENLSRLKEASLIRERLYGEYECARLLEYYMLPEVVEKFHHPLLKAAFIQVDGLNKPKGSLLKLNQQESQVYVTWIEATDDSFTSLFHLNQKTYLPLSSLSNPYVFLNINFEKEKLEFDKKELPPPLVWDIEKEAFIDPQNNSYPMNKKGMFFLYNNGLVSQFQGIEPLKLYFQKVLKHFAQDGLTTIETMLTNELQFLAKKNALNETCQILAFETFCNTHSKEVE